MIQVAFFMRVSL